MRKRKLLIIGGVAGGASCAARARRLSEEAEIIIFERGPFVSFANCGLPYCLGNVILKEEDLLVASPELFRERFNIEVRTESSVLSIDREKKNIEVEEIKNGRRYRESYDDLVLSPGAAPIRPNLKGADLPGIFTLRNIPDMRRIIGWIKSVEAKQAAVVGAGFIGLEMTENLKRLGIDVTIIEMQNQIMPLLDPEMAAFLQGHLVEHGVSVRIASMVDGFRESGSKILVLLKSGETMPVDLVILATGVRPEIELAMKAGLEIGKLGGIRVDEQMRTSDPRIWAVGDAVEIKDFVTGLPCLIPLAGPANRQGRIVADAILGKDTELGKFRGTQGTAVCGVMGLTVATTGVTEKQLKRLGDDSPFRKYDKVYLHPNQHAGYYPGAKRITLKVLFSKPEGRILGAQAVGSEGADKRIDVIAMAIQLKGTVFDIAQAELCYAPQYGSAKDPVNMAGMIAENILKGMVSSSQWEDFGKENAFILDVRESEEFVKGHLDEAINIPLGKLRCRLDELPRDKEIWTHCAVGQRSYYAARILGQNGFKVKNISGGYKMYPAVWKRA